MSGRRFMVLWGEAAIRDLEEIVAYVAVDSPLAAQNLLGKLRSRAESLEVTPLRGRVVPELARFGIRTFRELLVKPHRIVYRVSESTVFVMAILDGRRDLEDVLLERLTRET
jgi:toxin ParE1/3/4